MADKTEKTDKAKKMREADKIIESKSSRSNIIFKGIIPALITPFDSSGKIKADTVRELVDHMYQKGVNGFYVCGTTGEGPVLKKEARMDMLEAVMDNNRRRGKVIAHIAAPCHADTIELARHAEKAGADAVSSLSPNFFFNYTEDEIVCYYKSIADAVEIPLLVYVTPMFGDNTLIGIIDRLIRGKYITGLKFTMKNYFVMRKIKELNGGNINVINGPDEMLICGLSMGADGGIGSTYNVMPELYAGLYKAFTAGDISAAQDFQYRANRVTDVLIKHGDGSALKAIKETLKLMGFDAGKCAEPSKTYTKEEVAALKADLIKAGFKL